MIGLRRICIPVIGLMASVAALACDGGAPPEPDTDATVGLEVRTVADGVRGSFTNDDARVDFSSKFVEPDVIAIDLELNAMTISVLADLAQGVIEYDGFASDNGADTQMADADRQTLAAFKGALDALGEDADEPTVLLRRFVGTWSEFPSTLAMDGQALADTDKSYSSICQYVNTYQSASHDCYSHDWWSDGATIDYAYVSMHAAGPCSDGTYFLKNGSWQCYEPNHDTNVEYAYGNCLGRCGGGCGADTQFTWDCLDHDECVRVGHDTASFWCDDQFASTTDDWASAPDC